MLVTGATGGVGRRVVKELRSRGVPVRAMVRVSSLSVVEVNVLPLTHAPSPIMSFLGCVYIQHEHVCDLAYLR